MKEVPCDRSVTGWLIASYDAKNEATQQGEDHAEGIADESDPWLWAAVLEDLNGPARLEECLHSLQFGWID